MDQMNIGKDKKMGIFGFRSDKKKTPAKDAGEEHVKSIWGDFEGKEIVDCFEIEGVDIDLYYSEKIKVGSEVTVKFDREKDTFEYVCGGEVIGDVGNYTYEQMRVRSNCIRLLKEGRHMVITYITENNYGSVCNVSVGFI